MVGVTFAQAKSDPIYGSLGPIGQAKIEDLNDEQKLEKYLRNVKPIELKDDPEVV